VELDDVDEWKHKTVKKEKNKKLEKNKGEKVQKELVKAARDK